MEQGNSSGAEASIARARQAGRMNADEYVEEGLVWQRAGKLAQAESAYREAVRLAPDAPAGRNNLAFVLFDLGKFAEALLQWEAAIRLNPTDADSLAGRAIALDAMGKHVEALEAYRAAVSHDARFLDVAILKSQHMWSEAACTVARPLIHELSDSAHDGAAGGALT
jgi:Flp pilus assembly protein TadD